MVVCANESTARGVETSVADQSASSDAAVDARANADDLGKFCWRRNRRLL
jgi:hypothetical protein